MRPALVFILTIGLIGGMQWFLRPDSARTAGPSAIQLVQASGDFSVDITLTFDAGPDEFALSDVDDAPSLLVLMNGTEILRRTGNVAVDESPILVEQIQEVVIGSNEFFLQASPSDTDSLLSRCVRVRVLRDGVVVAEETLWSDGGEVVQGTVRIEVSK